MASKDLKTPNGGESKQAKMAGDSAVAGKPRVGARLDARSQEAIGKSLKAHYDDLVKLPIPDRFLELLSLLEAKERSSKPRDELDD